MSEEIVIALISGAVAIFSGFMSSFIGSSKAISYVEKTQAVLDTKLEDLTREVREHNNFAKRIVSRKKRSIAQLWNTRNATQKCTRSGTPKNKRIDHHSREDAIDLQSQCNHQRTTEKRIRYGKRKTYMARTA